MKLPPDRNTAFPDKSPFKTILQGIKADNILYLFVKQDIITIFAHYQKRMIMCKPNDYIHKTSQYINETFDLKVDIAPIGREVLNMFPVNITAGYHFYTANLLGREVFLLCSTDSSAYTPGQIQRQKELVERKVRHPVIFVFDMMASYNIQRLVRQRVNFIIPPRQMFIPDLLIDLKPQKAPKEEKGTQIPAIAQCAILYHLEVNSLAGKGTYEIADLFKVSYANANRAVRWLEEKEIVTLSGIKTKSLEFKSAKHELWDRALPFLANPVERVVYTDIRPDDTLSISGVNALSEYSMLNRERNGSYAVSKEEFRRLQFRTDKEYGENRIEIWRYNPKLLQDNGIVDKLSLFLSMKDIGDERIQIELENMINNMQW